MTGRAPLGQHFLADGRVIDEIVEWIAPREGDVFVEIGPGKGQLTVPLLDAGSKVIAIERDRELARRLPGLLGRNAQRCEVVVGDAAKGLPFPKGDAWRLVGNIPYEISSPLLALMVDGVEGITDAHLMLQREFATRIAASPESRDYGRITVSVQARFDVEFLLDVGPESFDPPPKVMSSVVRLEPNAVAASIDDSDAFDKVVKTAFAKRRKTLSNALSGLGSDVAGRHARKRAEDLPVSDYVELANDFARRPGR